MKQWAIFERLPICVKKERSSQQEKSWQEEDAYRNNQTAMQLDIPTYIRQGRTLSISR